MSNFNVKICITVGSVVAWICAGTSAVDERSNDIGFVFFPFSSVASAFLGFR